MDTDTQELPTTVTLQFSALGTQWKILIQDIVSNQSALKEQLENFASNFESTYSRFIDSSLISKMNKSSEPSHPVNQDLQTMLRFGLELQKTTNDAFSLNITELLEAHGYDKEYLFKTSKNKVTDFKPSSFSIQNNHLQTQGNLTLDLGSLGKGYLIDLLSKQLVAKGYNHFLVDGGGDIFATTKDKEGTSWKIALAYPGKPDEAIGTIDIHHQAFAVSGSDRRKVGKFHHLLDLQTKQPIEDILMVYVQGPSSMIADGCATAIFVSSSKYWPLIQKKFSIEYLVINTQMKMQKSAGFAGELFV